LKLSEAEQARRVAARASIQRKIDLVPVGGAKAVQEALSAQADEFLRIHGMGSFKKAGRDRKKRKARVKGEIQGVYVIGCAGFPVKVGIAKDIASRLATLKTGFPHKLQSYCFVPVPDGMARKIEKTCHLRLAESRMNGEWFDVTPEEAVALVNATVTRLTTH